MKASDFDAVRALAVIGTALLALVLVGCPSAGAGGGDEGGGSSTTPVEIVGFSVGEGDPPAINTTDVVLHMDVSGAVEMRFLEGDGGSFDGIDWQPYSDSSAFTLSSGDGIKTVRAQFRNDAGEVKTAEDEITLSTSGPTVNTFSIENGDAYTSSRSVSISIDVSDASEMRLGNEEESGSVDWESGWQSAGSNSRSWTLDDGDGEKTVRAAFRDVAGNETEVTDTIVLDTRAPSVLSFRINGGDSETSSLDVTLNSIVGEPAPSFGAATSGVAEQRFREDGGLWTDWMAYSETFPWTLSGGEGNHEIEAQFRDGAGNSTTTVSHTISFVRVPTVDSVSIVNTGGWAGQTADNVVEIHTTNARNVTEMRSRDDGQSWSDVSWEPFQSEKPHTLTSHTGNRTIYVQYRSDSGKTTSVFDGSIEYVPQVGNIGYAEILSAPMSTGSIGVFRAEYSGGSWQTERLLPVGTILLYRKSDPDRAGVIRIDGHDESNGLWEYTFTAWTRSWYLGPFGSGSNNTPYFELGSSIVYKTGYYHDLDFANVGTEAVRVDQSSTETEFYLDRILDGNTSDDVSQVDIEPENGAEFTVYYSP